MMGWMPGTPLPALPGFMGASAGLDVPADLPVFHHDIGINPATDIEFRAQSHEARLAGADQFVEYPVGDVLVECAFIAKRPDIQFEGFQFDALLVGNVFEEQCGEVRLASFRTEAGKLRRANADGVIPIRMRVGKDL